MPTNRNRRFMLIAALLVVVLAMAGCERKGINEIRANPSKYANQDVSVIGDVSRSFSLLGRGVYEVDDGTGKLWVVSDKGVPREGTRVVLKGTIRDGFNLNSLIKLPEAFSSGLVMIEKEHKAK